MKKKRLFDKAMLILAVISFVLASLEGFIYYANSELFFRLLMALQNGICAFAFNAKITISDMIESIDGANQFATIVGYLYGVAIVVAPFCVATAFYRCFQKILSFRALFSNGRKYENVLVFGFNDKVKRYLNNLEEENANIEGIKYRIQVITPEPVPEEITEKYIEKGILFDSIDFIASEKNTTNILKRIKRMKIEKIVFFDEDATKNFSLLHRFTNKEILEKFELNPFYDFKFYCYCDDDGIRNIIEEYYDVFIEENKIEDKADNNTDDSAGDKKTKSDKTNLIIFNTYDKQVTRMFEETPIYSYYKGKDINPDNWTTHILIVGLGELGEQVLYQSMNYGVISTQNDIIIDVIDNNIDDKKQRLATHFSRSYFDMSMTDEYKIVPPKADGNLTIRFRKVDIMHKDFQATLEELSKDNPFTYVTLCMTDMKKNIHGLIEVQRHINASGMSDPMDVPVCVRMEMDPQLAEYLNGNTETYNNVKIIGEQSEFTFGCIFDEKNDENAKTFIEIYKGFEIKTKEEENDKSTNQDGKNEDLKDKIEKQYKEIYKKYTSLALAYHYSTKKYLFDNYYKKEMKIIKNAIDSAPKKGTGNEDWIFDYTEQEMFEWICSYEFLEEMAKWEHRRWCYYRASTGWCYGDKKIEYLQKNPCMCNWENLKKTKPEYCKYDLMSIFYYVKEMDNVKR